MTYAAATKAGGQWMVIQKKMARTPKGLREGPEAGTAMLRASTRPDAPARSEGAAPAKTRPSGTQAPTRLSTEHSPERAHTQESTTSSLPAVGSTGAPLDHQKRRLVPGAS